MQVFLCELDFQERVNNCYSESLLTDRFNLNLIVVQLIAQRSFDSLH